MDDNGYPKYLIKTMVESMMRRARCQMSPNEFWTMASQFYENIKQKTSAEAHLLTTHDHSKGMLEAPGRPDD